MFGDISKAEQIFIACGYMDMRKSIDGLATLIQQNLRLNPFQNSLFLFCGRRRDRILPKGTKSPAATFASQGIEYCNKLSEIERALKDLSCEKRKLERLKQEKPVL